MLKVLALSATAVAGVAAADASALTRIDLTGTVYYTNGDAVPAFGLGTAATAWFEYDEKASGEAWYPGGVLDPTIFLYRHAPAAGGMRVGDYAVSFSGSARMFVTNQESASFGLIDRVLLDDHDPIGAELNGRPVDVVSISWQDNTATALGSLRLPFKQEAFDRFGSVTSSIDWAPYLGAAHRVSVSWKTVRVAAVPEPSSWMMMIAGFAVVGGALREARRRAASRPQTA